MLLVLALASLEKLINTAIASDNITQEQLGNLSGKILRLIMREPALNMDVVFCDDHLRFEPVSQSPFEPQGGLISVQPDCTLKLDNIKHLLGIIRQPGGNLPIEGDYRILMQLQAMLDGFEPQILDRLEMVLGRNLSSHLHFVSQELQPWINPLGQLVKNTFDQLLDGCQTDQSTKLDEELFDKKQELLRLQADIERHKARLDLLNTQANLDKSC